ncbi:hypothetical protein N7G274_006603 [Stereocaulon virgatum]|uniref:Heterokaryon incompatibility domain-containing protein n=1 Tax=Stereocaulon virgatum TaxID=373712 RepID=A0ABR4A7A5_9LECA
MSDERRSCQSCASILSDLSLFDALKSEAGVNISQTAQEFFSAVDQGCLICSAVHVLACGPRYSENAAFRCHPNSSSSGSSRLIKNIQVETTRPDSNDFKSVRVAMWSAENRYDFDQCFHVEAQEHDLAAEYISTRPIDDQVASSASYELAREWIRDCLLNHEECPRPEPSFLPTYMIDVGKKDGEGSVDVHLESGQKGPYAARSYCWGGPQPTTPTSLTMNDMLQCIAALTLPQTIQDAITVTRKLGLQYLWVYALCIIQDSAPDKDIEIAKMDRIHQNAQLTVSAASAERCQDGFLANRSLGVEFPPSSGFSSVPFACPDGRSGTVLLREVKLYFPSLEPLDRRAWALQERVLSPRVLIYGSWQMYWQCQSQHRCDD